MARVGAYYRGLLKSELSRRLFFKIRASLRFYFVTDYLSGVEIVYRTHEASPNADMLGESRLIWTVVALNSSIGQTAFVLHQM